ncbi:MAG: CopG family transcriptional regulator [Deltaproteobacteria bacterium]|nr:CopG family transcriptional regulator [Deltaproteobacteria bacterium]
MSALTKRATIYLEPDLHKAVRLKSVETARSMSDVINEAIRQALAEDSEDLESFKNRENEPVISFEEALKKLKKSGKI